MKSVKFYVAGQQQTCQIYDSEVERKIIESQIEKMYGKPVLSPFIPLTRDIKGN